MKKLFRPLLNFMARKVERSSWLLNLVRRHHFYKKGSLVYRINLFDERRAEVGGVQYQLDLGDDVQRFMFYNLYDQRELRFLVPKLKPGSIVFDVGASVGLYSLSIARQLQGRAEIHAFEASGRTFARLKQNCALNACASAITPHQCAVSAHAELVTFYEGPAHATGWGSLSDYGEEKRLAKPTIVQAISLDAFMQERKIELVDFMKLDVEGHEFDVLDGAKEGLRNRRFKMLMVEFNAALMAQKNKSLADFFDTFYAHGFTLASFNRRAAKKPFASDTVLNFFFELRQ